MLTIPHMLVGATTATIVTTATGSPVLGFVAAVASHFVMDMVPHYDIPPSAPRTADDEVIWTPAIWTQVVIDNGLGLVALLWLWMTQFGYPSVTPFVFGAIGGIVPDLVDNVPFWKYFFRRLPGFKQMHTFHQWTHHFWESRFPMSKYPWLGVLTQAVAVALSVSYLF